MAKKKGAKQKNDEEEKPKETKATKTKVVTFDTPGSDSPTRSADHLPAGEADTAVESEEPNSGSATWGESTAPPQWNNSDWDQQQAAAWPDHPSESRPTSPYVHSGAQSPHPTSPLPQQVLSPHPDPTGPSKDNMNMGMPTQETHDEFQNWGANQHPSMPQQWGTPLSDATTPISFASPQAGHHQPLAAPAVATTQMKISASEQARRWEQSHPPRRPPQPPSQPPPAAPQAPPAPAPASRQDFQLRQPMSTEQWTKWAKSNNVVPPNARHGNRDDFAFAAAALERELNRAAATGAGVHFKADHHSQREMRQSAAADGWPGGAHRGSGMGWGGVARSKMSERSGGHGHGMSERGGGHGSEAGFSQSNWSQHPRGAQHQVPSSKHSNNAWKRWGGPSTIPSETEETETEDEDEDGYYDNEEEDWGGQGNQSWGASGSGWNKADKNKWDQNDQNGGGWADDSGWGPNSNATGGGWDSQHRDGRRNSHQQNNWGQTKVITDPPENAGSRNVLSPQQHSQILNSLLNLPQGHSQRGVQLSDKPVNGSHAKSQSEDPNAWAQDTFVETSWGPIHEETETKSQFRHSQAGKQTQNFDSWGVGLTDSPSRTLAYAFKDAFVPASKPQQTTVHENLTLSLKESDEAALAPVHEALFGKARWAKDRIYWMFPANKDEKVTRCLLWVDSMADQLAAFGVHKFVQTRERGAILINVNFHLPEYPAQPLIDWLTFDRLQDTMDKILQESVIFYDPSNQVVIYLFLPSGSAKSIAIWRRKVKVPAQTRAMYKDHINQTLAGLKKPKDYVVYVDRLPLKPEDPDKAPFISKTSPTKFVKATSPIAPKKKRKWWQIFKSK